jgi:hypothetical protein
VLIQTTANRQPSWVEDEDHNLFGRFIRSSWSQAVRGYEFLY